MDAVKFIWMNGKLTPWEESNTHILTHTLHYGTGVFEGIRFYDTPKGPAIFKLKEHVDRLFYSAKAFEMNIPYSKEEIMTAIIKTVGENELTTGYIRPLVYFGAEKLGINPTGNSINVSIAAWYWGAYLGENPIKVKTSDFIRIHPKSTIADAKICGHYVNSTLASLQIKRAGYDEGLLLDYKGNIAEGPGENLFLVKNGKVITPKSGTILPGITRATIMDICGDLNIEVREETLKLEDAYNADEAFFVGTAAEVTPIGSIDDNLISEKMGEVTSKIRNAYMDIVKGKNSNYEKDLSYVR